MYEPDYIIEKTDPRGVPRFMKEFEITPVQRQTMATKLDSVIIKGSKILAHHPNSDYVEGTLFLMAKAYFYRNEYLPSQIKCSESVDKFPGGEYSPDAHLLFAKNLLMQRNFEFGITMLSRCVDIAWQKERYDILSEAFRLQAEISLYKHDKEGATRPYLQAIAQSEDSEFSAEMQNALGTVYFRLGMFEEAAAAFDKVSEYSPSYVISYESDLYKAIALSKIGKNQDAAEILEYLDNDGKFEEWKDYTYVGKLYVIKNLTNEQEIIEKEKYADTAKAISNNRLLAVYYFEKGAEYYEENDYTKANTYFSKAKNSKTPALYTAAFLTKNIGDIFRYKKMLREIKPSGTIVDTVQSELNITPVRNNLEGEKSSLLYEIGRSFERLGKPDSSYGYYKTAAIEAPDTEYSARYFHAWQRFERDRGNMYIADSIAEHIADKYPNTEYGLDAMEKLGFVVDYFIVDTLAELYSSGQELRKNGEYMFAIDRYQELYKTAKTKKGSGDYAPKALYAIGWTYEKNLLMRDSSSSYYIKLLEEYPNSKYAKEFTLSLAYVDAIRSGEKIPDSLMQDPNRTIVPEFKPIQLQPLHDISTPTPPSDGLFDAFTSPETLIEKGKNFFNNTFDETVRSVDSTVNSSINDLDSLRNYEIPDIQKMLPNDTTNAKIDSTSQFLGSPAQDSTQKK